ncbi:MAG: protein ImuB [Arenicella sp.]|jgi:protein ImuB
MRFSMLSINSLGVRFNGGDAVAVNYRQQVWQANEVAQEASVSVGQSVDRALMLVPDIQFIQRDSNKEAQKLSSLNEWAYRFTSHVHVYDDHTLLLEIGRSLALFSGLKHLQHLIIQQLDKLAVDAEFGLANTPKAAHLLSYCRQLEWQVNNSKEILPYARLEHLALDKKIVSKLQHCGFNSLGDILSIPFSDLGQRFGKQLVDYLDQLLGRVADPIHINIPAERFVAKVNFAEPIRNRTWIEQQVQRLLKDLVAFIENRNVVCRCFTWRFYSENNRLLKTIDIRLNSSGNDFNTFALLTDLQFESTDMHWEFSAIELLSESLIEKRQYINDLFQDSTGKESADHESISQLLDKLASRLGYDALYKVSAQAEHLPELVNQRCQIEHTSTSREPLVSDFKDEPLWLLEHPKRLFQKDKKPIHKGPLKLIHGPHRVISHWWSSLYSRDYYIAQQVSGQLLWVYYDRKQDHWYLHGLFA